MNEYQDEDEEDEEGWDVHDEKTAREGESDATKEGESDDEEEKVSARVRLGARVHANLLREPRDCTRVDRLSRRMMQGSVCACRCVRIDVCRDIISCAGRRWITEQRPRGR